MRARAGAQTNRAAARRRRGPVRCRPTSHRPAVRNPTSTAPIRALPMASTRSPKTRSSRGAAGRPGSGGTLNVFMAGYYPAPTPHDQNPTWKEVEKALNSTVNITITPNADYSARFQVVMAGNDLPGHHARRRHGGVVDLRAIRAGAVFRSDALPGRRRRQGLSEPGGHSRLRLQRRGRGLRQPPVRHSDPSLSPGVLVLPQHRHLGQGDRRRRGAQRRRRLQEDPPAAQSAAGRTLGDRQCRTDQRDHVGHRLVPGVVRRAQPVEPGLRAANWSAIAKRNSTKPPSAT